MINVEVPINAKESVQLNPEIYPVTGGLIEMRSGFNQGAGIVRRILDHEVSRIIFLGEPGNGKTTVMSEVMALIREQGVLFGSVANPEAYFYDTFLSQEQKRKKR